MKELFQTADWKSEKHAPVITVRESAEKGEILDIELSVGKEIPHPNTTEHHISWIELYFHPEGEKFPYALGKFEFSCHGASVQGPDSSTVYTHPKVVCSMKTEKSGSIHAMAYCNIHGLWSSVAELKVK